MGLLLRQGEKAAPDTGPGPGRPGRRFAVLCTVGLLLGLGALYLAGYFLTSDRLPRDASVAGVEIGALSPAAAREKLESDLVPRVSRPVEATHDGKSHEINPAEAGLGLDVAATVESAGGGRSLNPLRMIEVLTGGEDISPVIETNQQAMDRVVSGLADKVERAPVEGTVRFRGGRAKPVYPTPGGTLDQDETAQALTATFLDEEATFDLPMRQEPAELTEEDVDRAMTEFAEPAMSGPVMVEVPGRSARITPAQISAALTMEPQDGELVPRLDRKKLAERTEDALDRLTRDARPAKVVLSDGEPEVVPGRNGTKVNRARLASNLLPVLSVTAGQERTIALKVSTAEPEFDTAAARKLGIDEPVSQFTTYFPHSDYRNTNLGRAAELISGTVLRPGETFSLNDVVGERTAENGFTKGYVISDGALVEDFGGGVSQVATTTYNAAFFAGMKDIEHHPHSFYIDRYPMGREATVAWGALDLQFQNTTPYGVMVQAWIEPSSPSAEGEMHVRMWSTEYWDIEAGLSEQYDFTDAEVRYDTSDSCVEQIGYGGFEVDVYRYFNRNGERVDSETDHVIYNPAPTVHCRPAPKEGSSDSQDGGNGGGGG